MSPNDPDGFAQFEGQLDDIQICTTRQTDSLQVTLYCPCARTSGPWFVRRPPTICCFPHRTGCSRRRVRPFLCKLCELQVRQRGRESTGR